MLRPPPKPIAKPGKQRPRLHREGPCPLHMSLRHQQCIPRLLRRSHQFRCPPLPPRRTRLLLLRPQLLPLPPPLLLWLRNLQLQHLLRRRLLLPRPLRSQSHHSRRRPRPARRSPQSLPRQLLRRFPLLPLYRLRCNSRGLQRLQPQHNNLLRVLRQAVLRRQAVRSNLDNSLRQRALLLLHNPCVPVRLVPVNRARHWDDRCPQGIVGRFPEQFPVADAPVVLVPASPCGRNNPAKGRVDVPLRLVPVVLEVPVVRAEQALPIVRGDKGPARSRPARVPALVHPVVPRCCRRFPTKCHRRRSPASRYTHASRHNASVLRQISAKWKASASFTRRASVPARVGGVPRSRRLLLQSRARRATSL